MIEQVNDNSLSSKQAPSLYDTSNTSIIDLFAGVGGLSLGAMRAGFKLALAVELDKHAMAAHQLNFPNSKHLLGDIESMNGDELLNKAGLNLGELGGLIGGPPCQGFSIIGKRAAVDARNNLFSKFFHLVSECRPSFFIAENVPGILDKKYEDIRESALEFVSKDYTLLHPLKLKASDFGIPTTRERVFFIGYKPEFFMRLSHEDFERQKPANSVRVAEALDGLPIHIQRDWLTEEQSWREIEKRAGSYYWERISGCIPNSVGDTESIYRYKENSVVSGCFGTRHSPSLEARYKQLEQGQKDRISKSVRLKLDGFCPTLRAGTASDRGSFQAVRPIHPTLPRVITPREAARLQGFPDWYRFAPSKWHSFRQIGNSVSPILAEIVFKVIYSHIAVMEAHNV